MSRHPFRLTTLKRLREAERDQRRAELADALAADALLLERIERLGREADAWRQQTRHAAAGTVDVDQWAQANRYRWLMRAQQQQLQEQRKKLEGEIERRRQALVEADRELKVVEKLEQRHDEAERLAALRSEQKILDEMGNRAHFRKEAER